MTVKASVSISDKQNALARELVEQGRFSSLSAVVQHGLELVRQETELKNAEIEALRVLLEDRRRDSELSQEQGRDATLNMLARKRADRGL